jgi:hypothetical protein
MRFLREERHDEVLCRLYSIGGEGFGGAEGRVWVEKARGHIVDIEIPLANNGEWRDFKLELQTVHALTPEAWRAWKHETIANYFE